MSELLEVVWPLALVVIGYVSFLYLISWLVTDASIIDVGWGVGFVIISTILLSSTHDVSPVQALVHILVTIWGIRLATHILVRKIGKPEDWRYAKWRKEWGEGYQLRAFLQIFILQGLLMLLVAMPIFVSSLESTQTPLGLPTVVGVSVWVVGFCFEAVGDYQLQAFLKLKPKKGSVMKSGVWKYSRHPNYFGEVTQWWGLFIIVAGVPLWGLALVSPLTITYLLLKVSGIPMLEKKWDTNRQYQAYKKVTSPFFPLRPKSIKK